MTPWATTSLQELSPLFVQLKSNLACSQTRDKAPCYLWDIVYSWTLLMYFIKGREFPIEYFISGNESHQLLFWQLHRSQLKTIKWLKIIKMKHCTSQSTHHETLGKEFSHILLSIFLVFKQESKVKRADFPKPLWKLSVWFSNWQTGKRGSLRSGKLKNCTDARSSKTCQLLYCHLALSIHDKTFICWRQHYSYLDAFSCVAYLQSYF